MFAVTHRYKETRNIDERKKSRENTELVVQEKFKKTNQNDQLEDLENIQSKINQNDQLEDLERIRQINNTKAAAKTVAAFYLSFRDILGHSIS